MNSLFKKVFLFALMFLTILITSCSPNPSPINQYLPTYTPRPEPDCALISPPTRASWGWNEITIGISTGEDIMKKFGQPKKINSIICPQIQVYQYKDGSSFTIINNILDRIEIRSDPLNKSMHLLKSFPLTLQDAKVLYGEPDMIGFLSGGSVERVRYVVWSQRGVMVLITLSDTKIGYVYYFSPRPLSQMSEYYWANSILTLPSGTLPESRNPFDQWQRWWLTEEK